MTPEPFLLCSREVCTPEVKRKPGLLPMQMRSASGFHRSHPLRPAGVRLLYGVSVISPSLPLRLPPPRRGPLLRPSDPLRLRHPLRSGLSALRAEQLDGLADRFLVHLA